MSLRNAPRMRHVVDAAVLKEAPIFNGDDGLHEVRRNLVVSEQAALGAVGVFAEAGDEQRLELVAGKRLAFRVDDRRQLRRRSRGWWRCRARDKTAGRAAP